MAALAPFWRATRTSGRAAGLWSLQQLNASLRLYGTPSADSSDDIDIWSEDDEGEKPVWSKDLPVHGPVKPVNVLELRPTQLAVGMKQVKVKVAELKRKEENGKLHYYLHCKHPIPVVLGPAGPGKNQEGSAKYMLDKHHLATAINLHTERDNNGDNGNNGFYWVAENWSCLSWEKFWEKMEDRDYIWPHSPEGKELKLEEYLSALPTNVKGLQNDPYRSLAGKLRKDKHIDKVDVPFTEFKWANWLRARGAPLPRDWRDEKDENWEKAMKLVHSSAARRANLPGYRRERLVASKPDCPDP